MAIARTEKQTRSLKTELKTRAEGDNNLVIEGYFVVFNSPTELWPGATEQIASGAFDNTLTNDVRALINHDTTLVLGRSKAGTLALKTDARGLWGSITINPNDTDAMNLYSRVQRGDVDQCSFGFNVTSEDTVFNDDGTVNWTITGVDLIEVSVCTFPAYEDTGVAARSKDFEQLKEKQLEVRKANLKARLNKHGN